MSGRIRAVWLLLLSLGSFTVVACGEEAPLAVLTTEGAFLDADGILIGGEYVFLNADGVRASHLNFDTMYQWRDSVDRILVGVDLRVFNEDGSERAHVTALRGRMDERGERLLAQGDVVLTVTSEGRRLESGELHYDPNLERIWSDSSFVMTMPGRTPVRGGSFESDLEFRNFRATGPGGS